jgi:hypothetical protein
MAYPAEDGSVIISATLPSVSAKLSGVDVIISIEDPSRATEDDPAEVTVVAADPMTAQVVTSTTQVTAPEQVAEVTTDAVSETLAEVVQQTAPLDG